MAIEAVIFDLDGVIVFTDKFHYQAWKCIADRLGIEFDEEKNNRLRGVSRLESLEIILEQYEGKTLSAQEKIALTEEKNIIYRDMLETLTPEDVAAEVKETLIAIKNRGYLIAIGSSSKNAKFILERVQLLDCFDAIIDGNDISKTKPDPEVFLKGAKSLGIHAKNCLVVEDANAGIEAGIAAGMLTAATGAAVNSGQADYHLASFDQLLGILP